MHVVDVSEKNNLVELVRDIRSSLGYIDAGSLFKHLQLIVVETNFIPINANENYDYIFNLSALKHVRSEKDLNFNEINPQFYFKLYIDTIKIARETGCKKYFCVSTDKATNPVNMMGASKRIMEYFLFRESEEISISTARFANVAFLMDPYFMVLINAFY